MIISVIVRQKRDYLEQAQWDNEDGIVIGRLGATKSSSRFGEGSMTALLTNS